MERGAGAALADPGAGAAGAGRAAGLHRITKAQVAYLQILAAFGAVEEWIAARGLTVAGPCREMYFADWGGRGPRGPGVRRGVPGGLSRPGPAGALSARSANWSRGLRRW